MSDASRAWEALDLRWQRALARAWESVSSGSFGAGAVVSAADGSIIGEGRSCAYEAAVADQVLAGNPLARAPVNALARLPSSTRFASCTLWSTVSPCLLGAAAAAAANVGTVRYLAADPLWAGVEDLAGVNPYVQSRWPTWIADDEGPFSVFALLLPLHTLVYWHSDRIDDYRGARPGLSRLVERLVERGGLVELGLGAVPVEQAIAALWSDLPAGLG
jgi:tRNA(Arg) A34 adenosine deaminase TadA